MRKILVAGWLLAAQLVLATLSSAAETDVNRLLEFLIKEKVITQEKATEFRADLAVKKQEDRETQKEFTLIAGKPIKLSGYTQVRYLNDKSKKDAFDIRRARLDLRGDITERWDYRTQIDFAGGATSSTTGAQSYSVKLLDAIIGYKVNPYLKLSIGQQKIPFSQENLASSPKLETINRSQVVEAMVARGADVIGNQNGRDIGIQASGSILPVKAGYNLVDYAFGIFNGAGINSGDTNEQKDFIGRLLYHPFKEWSVGGSYYAGRYSLTTSAATFRTKDDRDRIGVEFAYLKDILSLKGEYIKGNDGATNRDGWYLQAGYFFIPKKFQGVFKFDTYDSDTKIEKNEKNVYTLGGNWYFNKWAFLQVNYELKDERGKELDNNALTGQLTLQF